MTKLRTIYTDGGCYEGIGSWAYLVLEDIPEFNSEPVYKLAGLSLGATNNRMEMMAIIEAVSMQPTDVKLRVCSDSGYVITGFTHPAYLKKWLINGWRTSKNQPVENKDLWEEIIRIDRSHNIEWVLVKGHGKNKNPIHNKFNNIVDKMCTEVRHGYNEALRRAMND